MFCFVRASTEIVRMGKISQTIFREKSKFKDYQKFGVIYWESNVVSLWIPNVCPILVIGLFGLYCFFEARAPSDPLLLKKKNPLKIIWEPFQNPNGGLYWSFKGPCLSSLWTEDQRAPAQTLYKKFPGKNILGEILFALPFPSPPPPRAKRQ